MVFFDVFRFCEPPYCHVSCHLDIFRFCEHYTVMWFSLTFSGFMNTIPSCVMSHGHFQVLLTPYCHVVFPDIFRFYEHHTVMCHVTLAFSGFVNTILSWSAFVPLSRLTYCIYLLHIMIMELYLLNSNTVFYMSDLNFVSLSGLRVFVSLSVGFVQPLYNNNHNGDL